VYYVYLLRSVSHPQETYIGFTQNLKSRMEQHNQGQSLHTRKFVPWVTGSFRCILIERSLKKNRFRSRFRQKTSISRWERPAARAPSSAEEVSELGGAFEQQVALGEVIVAELAEIAAAGDFEVLAEAGAAAILGELLRIKDAKVRGAAWR
jgi:GIY-YIG catalytic domain